MGKMQYMFPKVGRTSAKAYRRIRRNQGFVLLFFPPEDNIQQPEMEKIDHAKKINKITDQFISGKWNHSSDFFDIP